MCYRVAVQCSIISLVSSPVARLNPELPRYFLYLFCSLLAHNIAMQRIVNSRFQINRRKSEVAARTSKKKVERQLWSKEGDERIFFETRTCGIYIYPHVPVEHEKIERDDAFAIRFS